MRAAYATMTPAAHSLFRRLLWGAVVLGTTVVSYLNSLSGAFVFDDGPAILRNASIRQLSAIATVLTPPTDGSPVTGRPLTNLTFALNYAAGGAAPAGYHVANVAIHLAAALILFGLLARTLVAHSGASGWVRAQALPLAAFCASLWAAHPLLTDTVTYLAQRSEELVGLCFLLTFYGLVRSSESPSRFTRTAWLGLSVLSCWLGMAAKEVMATAPVLVLLYDRAFLSGDLVRALRTRPGYYAGLAASWILLSVLLVHSGSRGGTIGFGTPVSSFTYLTEQAGALVHYLQLCAWPHPLVIDYGSHAEFTRGTVLLGTLLAALGVAATAVGLWHNSPLGFLGAWFFIVLAPTSSFIPVATEVMAEHRLYLPLAAVLAAIVFTAAPRIQGWIWPALGLAVAACIVATRARNRDYQSALALWTETVAAQPQNAGAHNNRGAALLQVHQDAEAITEFKAAAHLDPSLAGARNNLGSALLSRGRYAEAAAEFAAAVRLSPHYPEARLGLADALAREGNFGEAVEQYTAALAVGADRSRGRRDRGVALLRAGRATEAMADLRAAVAASPNDAKGHTSLAFGLEGTGHRAEAEEEYRTALRLDPASDDAAFDLGNLLFHEQRLSESIEALQEAVRINPARAEALGNLGGALLAAGKPAEALGPCAAALRLKPDLVEAEVNLGNAWAALGRYRDAIAAYRSVVAAHPDYALAHHNLAAALHAMGDDGSARTELEIEHSLRTGGGQHP